MQNETRQELNTRHRPTANTMINDYDTTMTMTMAMINGNDDTMTKIQVGLQ